MCLDTVSSLCTESKMFCDFTVNHNKMKRKNVLRVKWKGLFSHSSPLLIVDL